MPVKGSRFGSMLTCAVCGVEFYRKASRVPKGSLSHCSRKCLNVNPPRRPLGDRLWEKVDKTETCWIKRGAGAGQGGYGVISPGGREPNVYAHIAAWFLATGHWPTSKEKVCHTCDVPRCVRNDDVGTYEVNGILYERHGHLWLGTDKANSDDKIAKGRTNRTLQIAHAARGDRNGMRLHPESVLRGERSRNAKLTAASVIEARQRYAAGGVTHLDLATEYGVTEAAMRFALIGRTWKHV